MYACMYVGRYVCMHIYIYIYNARTMFPPTMFSRGRPSSRRGCSSQARRQPPADMNATICGGTSYQDPANQDPLSRNSENTALRN